ncbi:serine/threonine-protein kinase [Mycolicibacterium sphagni]|uniref:serine/threonine-protein kinase n=1 Tax=Mycolicibacterium sphagni TaxID=1786 RepID=UPI0021F25B8E|nr:serine/threonine-protein kinase [Mycolicibacterium sphagni]MCV7176165.1 serine/threonine protein kinase [Mycolicibacterium sphagni]
MSLADGAVFAGYTIVRLLGVGGMGEVYLVQHPRLPRQEALKILPASISASPDYRQRFAREADIAASLWHPHLLAVHDRGDTDGQLWITMDYVDGTDAAQLMRDRYPYGMPPADVIDIISAVADALDYAHARYLLHRDVKPANILITDPHGRDRRILLADFGIARDINDTSGLTATNVTVGSVAYAAPEQLTGKALDGRADQYALACTAFHLLTGRLPYADSNAAVVIGNHLSSPPPRLSTLRPDLGRMDEALGRAMAKEPYQRFDTCHDFATALAHGATNVSGPADITQLSPGAPAPPTNAPVSEQNVGILHSATTSKRRTALVAGSVGAGLLAVGAVAFLGARLGQTPAPPTAAPAYSPTVTPWSESVQPPQTVTQTAPPVTITAPQRVPTPRSETPPPAPPRSPPGDLGLAQPISQPQCNGQGIVIVGNVTTPGLYAAGIERLLEANPGAFYLRTDQTCPSLRAANEQGNPIYSVFIPAGNTQAQVCAAVHAAGGNAYGKWLNYTTDPGFIIPC